MAAMSSSSDILLASNVPDSDSMLSTMLPAESMVKAEVVSKPRRNSNVPNAENNILYKWAAQFATGRKNEYQCPYCDQKCIRPNNLADHIRVHTGDRPFVCDKCKKGFARKSALVRHERVHWAYKPFACNVCQRSFADKSNLRSHLRLHLRKPNQPVPEVKQSSQPGQRQNMLETLQQYAMQHAPPTFGTNLVRKLQGGLTGTSSSNDQAAPSAATLAYMNLPMLPTMAMPQPPQGADDDDDADDSETAAAAAPAQLTSGLQALLANNPISLGSLIPPMPQLQPNPAPGGSALSSSIASLMASMGPPPTMPQLTPQALRLAGQQAAKGAQDN